jgi:hypothetical protein
MLKMVSSCVLGRPSPATYLRGYALVAKRRPAHRLASAHKRGVTYSWRRAPPSGLIRCTARLGAQGWVGENEDHFEHPRRHEGNARSKGPRLHTS